MPDGLSVLGFAPTIQIIGGTISKIFNRPYAMFTEGDEHLRRCAWNILEPVFNAKVPSLSIKSRLNALRPALRLGTWHQICFVRVRQLLSLSFQEVAFSYSRKSSFIRVFAEDGVILAGADVNEAVKINDPRGRHSWVHSWLETAG